MSVRAGFSAEMQLHRLRLTALPSSLWLPAFLTCLHGAPDSLTSLEIRCVFSKAASICGQSDNVSDVVDTDHSDLLGGGWGCSNLWGDRHEEQAQGICPTSVNGLKMFSSK